MTRRRDISVGALTLALGAVAATTPNSEALAHVGSSPDVNNRYYRLVPMADRVRVQYSVFVGEEPARYMRKRIDRDHDGSLSAAEAKRYAKMIESEIAKSVTGQLRNGDDAIRWSELELSFPSAGVEDGAFQFHRVGRVCYAPGAPRDKELRFVDRLRLPSPGESELHIEVGPGIRAHRSELAGIPASFEMERWLGGPGPAQHGYLLGFEVDAASAPAANDQLCAPKRKEDQPQWLAFLGVFVAAGAAVLGALALRNRRRRGDAETD